MLIDSPPFSILISLSAPTCEQAQRITRACPGAKVTVGPWLKRVGEELPPTLMKGVDILLCEVPPANFSDFDTLKWIQLTSAGYSQVVGLPILERGIRVTNGLGNFDSPIAQWNIMMMLIWHREMLSQLENQKNAVWRQDAEYQRDVYGTTVGFWGYGGIARETARLAKAMNQQVWVMTRDGTVAARSDTYCAHGTGDPEAKLPDRVLDPAGVRSFLGGLDYLFITMPHTKATEGIVGERELRMLKSSAVLINPARAPIVQEQALIRCLREGWIRGASLDVHYAYPLPAEHPLWRMQNAILTPHISGSAESTHFGERLYDIFTQNLERFLKADPMLNELSPRQLRGE